MNLLLFNALILTLLFLTEVFTEDQEGLICLQEAKKGGKNADISVFALKDSYGDWKTVFSAKKRVENTTIGVNLELKQSVVNCGSTNVFYINGIFRDVNYENYVKINSDNQYSQIDALGFSQERKPYERKVCPYFDWKLKGKNIEISNGGRTATRKDAATQGTGGSVVTKLPLVEDELFQVRVDKTIDSSNYSGWTIAIGVIQERPSNITSLEYIWDLKGNWRLSSNSIKKDGYTINTDYPQHLIKFPEGVLIGVMRKRNGDLHFYENGADMGKAASDIPKGVYGYIELCGWATEITVVC